MITPTVELLLKANAYLIEAEPKFRSYAQNFKKDFKSQRQLLRDLMNMYQPLTELPSDFYTIADSILSYENAHKTRVSLANLKASNLNSHIYHYQGDITALDVDAIVNAANRSLLGCFIPGHLCIDNCIHSASGLQLRFACKAIGSIHTTEARITKAYNLGCKYIIHAVGPMVFYELTPEDENKLKTTYNNILDLCVKYQIHSVAICCIATGAFRFPHHRACDIAIETVAGYLKAHPVDLKVIFNTFKDRDAELYSKALLSKTLKFF